MPASLEMYYAIDIAAPLVMHDAETMMVEGDNKANTLVLEVLDGKEPAVLAGCTAIAYMLRPDGEKPFVKCEINGNIITAVLNEVFYTTPGRYTLFVRLTEHDGATKRTILLLNGWVQPEGDGELIDTDGAIPSLDDLLAQIEQLENAVQSANEATMAANDAAQYALDAAETAKNFTGKGLADGMRYDADSGDLQLTSKGEAIPGAKVTIKLTDSYTKNEVDTKFQEFEQSLGDLDFESATYYATYGTETLDNGEETENVFTLWEVDKDGVESVKSRFVIQGGGGGSVTTNLKVGRITPSPLILTPTDKAEIAFSYSSTDGDGETIDGTYSLKLGSTVVASGPCIHGENTIDVMDYVNVGTQKFTLTVTDEGGSVAVKSWTVQIVDVRIESEFRDSITYPAGREVAFTYTPYGAIPKTVHFKLDGVELPSATVGTSGIPQSYKLPAQAHGAHLLECWITAQVNTVTVETEHIFRDIVWWDDESTVPVIGCIYRHDHYGKVTAKQYNTTPIQLHVFDPSTASPVITKEADGTAVSTETLTGSSTVWAYKTSVIGDHTLAVSCGDTSVTIVMDIVELGINVEPITAGLAFDFDPTTRSNTSEDRLWRDPGTGVAMSVSDNFDWINGGYKLDDEGNQFFCVKAGTRATFDHKLFAQDASVHGAEFKLIFRVTNVRRVDTTFLDCLAGDTPVGLRMDAHAAYLMTSATGDKPLYMPYAENDVMEFEFNIDTLDQEDAEATSVIMSYEDGVGYRPLIYDSSHRLYQYAADAVPIVIGSDDCDVHIYRMKAYTTALSDSAILSNFIADARDAETMIARYERNQIYNENNELTPESVALACPQLKVIKIDAPYFTQDKGELIKDTVIECIHKGGDAVLDNWVARNCYHSGQGTTSNEYGYAGRNLNIYMCCDGEWTHDKITHDPAYLTQLTMGDGRTITDGTGKVTLTRNSVPNALFNIKVNIASSENANNALLAMRYDKHLPYTPVSRLRDSNAKTTMEFVNCVVFIRENDPDLSKHREFQDTSWHFYAIGNMGDSKDTDQTRAYDPDDHNEFVVEISDNTMPNSTFPTGVVDASGKQVCPISASQWKAGNPAYDSLHNAWGDTYEFRYQHPDVTDAEEAANIAVWNNLYKWIVTSSDANFKAHLTDWFTPGAAEYMYTFTENFTMTDNRAKNTFWHWSKVYITATAAQAMGAEKAARYTVDDAAAAINGGYRFDFWDYDNDTSIGINNSGEMTQPAGKEDIDYRIDGDPNSGYIYNAAESTFFCRVRELMHSELAAMYLSRETAGCWDAEAMIAEFDTWQEQFPEELWRLDIERKYIRTYKGGTKRFLETMLNGRKKYHRRQWLRDQAAYMGTKYVSASVKADQIMFRCNTPDSAVVAPNYDLTIIPYSDMYLSVLYGNSPAPIQIRAKAGQEYKIENPLSGKMDDTAVLIYCASRIQALNDLSGAYIHDNDFSKAEKLQTLVIGNATSGYSNVFLTALNIGNNPLLETLDVRGCPNLTGSLNLTACGNLVTLLAQGTALKGVTFAPNGAIQTAILPSTVNTLVMRNLNYLTGLYMSYDSLESLTEEYSVVDELAIVRAAADTLQTVKLAGIDWVLGNTEVLNTLLAVNSASLSGKVHINGPIRQQEFYLCGEKWPDLQVTYESMVQQYPVTFKDWDGTVLHVEYVDRNGTATDPVAAGVIPTPTRESTVSTVYTYAGWDGQMTNVMQARTLTATYTESARQYTVRWHGYQGELLDEQVVNYGTDAVYAGEVPTRTDEESMQVFYQFIDWDKSTGFVNEDINVHPVWERGDLPEIGTDTETMNATQIYAIKRNNMAKDYFQHKDRVLIPMGYSPEFTNVEHVDVATDMVLDGTTYIDTGIKLLSDGISEPWTLVVNFEYYGQNGAGTILHCMQDDGYMGFNVKSTKNKNAVQWGTNSHISETYASQYERELFVLRHEAGSRNLKVYVSNCNFNSIGYSELIKTIDTVTNATLVVGAAKSDSGEYFDHATGKLHSCRIWYGDLGDTTCRKIAKWPFEVYKAEVGTFGAYKLASNSAKSTQVDFIFASLLSRTSTMNASATNKGGFEASKMYNYMVTRVLTAFPEIWQRMLEECTVNCLQYVDGTNHNISPMKAKIWLPSYIEVQGGTRTPWAYEGADHIPYFITNQARVKWLGNDALPRDGYNTFTGSDDPTLDAGNTIIEGDVWYKNNEGTYWLRNGGRWINSYNAALRSASITNAANFAVTVYTGWVNETGYSAAGSYGICPRFSI